MSAPPARLGLRDAFLGATVAFTWGIGIVFAKAAIEHFPPILLMSLRFLVTALVLVWFVKPPFGLMWRLWLVAIISAAIQYSLTFTGLAGLDASVVALVVQLEVPFLVLLGAIFLGERPGWRKWLGIVFAFIGVALIAGEPRLNGAWKPLLMVVGGGVTWAIGQTMIRSLDGLDGLVATAWVAVFAAPQLLVMSLIFESGHMEALTTATPVVWLTVLYLGLVMTALGYGIWYSLLRRHPVSSVAPFLLLLPVFSVAGAVLILGETLPTSTMIGGLIIISGVAFIVFERDQEPQSPPDTASPIAQADPIVATPGQTMPLLIDEEPIAKVHLGPVSAGKRTPS